MTAWATRFSLLLAGIALLLACNVSTTDQPDTLTFRLPDSLKASEGKYDTVRLDLYSVSEADTILLETLFDGPYNDPGQLKKLPLPSGLDGAFLVRVTAYKEGRRLLDLGVPFADGRQAGKNVVYPLPSIDSIPANRAPAFTSGLQSRSMMEGEVVTITVKARDEDGDAFSIRLQNLDSLRGMFPNRPEATTTFADADSLMLRFDPGAAPGNYRFRLSVADSAGAGEVQVLAVSVGKVNRPPRLSFLSPAGTTSFRVLEGQTLLLRIAAEDPDSGDATRLLPLDQPPWPRCGSGAYDTISGTLTFTPAYTCVGHGESTFSNLVFRAVDNGNPPETGEIAASITVVDANTAPKWGPGPVILRGKEGRNLTLDLAEHFSGDAEGDSVAFSTTCGTVYSEPLRWSFTPGFRDSGQKTCILTATDSHQPPAGSQLALDLFIEDSTRALDVAILSPERGAVFRDSLIRVSWQVGSIHLTTDTTEKLKAEGPNLIRRSLLDSLGNEGFDTLTVYLDTKPPLKPKVRSPG
jgi:hypothetical protein